MGMMVEEDCHSSHKKTITAMDIAKKMIDETIHKFDTTKFPSDTFCIADFGCSVGPNTFLLVKNIIEAIKRTFTSHKDRACNNRIPTFQVFFNDLVFNDFNALFKTLPPDREYFAAGVPGSFYGRLFPVNTLHFAVSSYALQWLSEVPARVLEKGGPMWNKGRIHYTCASEDVAGAYAEQFAEDLGKFLEARAEELVEGGIVVIMMPCHGINMLFTLIFRLVFIFGALECCFLDMVNEGLISSNMVDSFNIPLYNATPEEVIEIIHKNKCFSIERMEGANCSREEEPSPHLITSVLRGGMEGIISKHFGSDIIDELFDRFQHKIVHLMPLLSSTNSERSHLTIFLKRRPKI